MLAKLAEGAPGARLTQEAKASLERLAKRAPSAPSVVTWIWTRARISSAVQPVFCSIRASSYSLENR